MNETMTLEEFIDHPETMDFMVRRSEYLMEYFQNNPNIVLTQTLMGRYVIGYTDRKYSADVIKNLGSSYANSVPLVCGLLDTESLEAAGIYQVQQQPYLDLKGGGVLVGFVDTGIDYTKDIFIYEDRTSKIQYIYDQTVRGNTPEGFFLSTGTHPTGGNLYCSGNKFRKS